MAGGDQPIPANPTKIVIEGVGSNNIIDVSATKNVEGTKKFFAHDDQGNPLTNLDWQMSDSTDQTNRITLDNNTGQLNWSNTLMPNRIYSFILTCSDNANQLTSASCMVKIDVVESPGDGTTSFNMFNVSDSGVLTLKDNVDRNSIKRVVIPNILNGLSVTTIGDYAFSDCTSLASVDLGSVAPSMVRPSLIAHLSHLLI